MLSVTELTKIFKDVTAVNRISFQVQKGKIFGLLGPNGAGKTTTIRTVLNIIKPTSGSITFEDRPITNEFFNIIGYLPEERGLYRKSKVLNVILYFARLKSMPSELAVKEAERWLDLLGIPEYRNKKIEELSKGNQQKVQFICAVIHNPGLLILDEPFSGFDPINQQLIKETILSFANSGKVIVLSTHQMETAEKLCSDILLMNNGAEVCGGSISQVKKQFGSNNVKLEFEGDASFLRESPAVINIDNYSNYAEVQLKDDVQPYEFLRSIAEKLKISHFSVIEPTLNKIFIDVINQSSK